MFVLMGIRHTTRMGHSWTLKKPDAIYSEDIIGFLLWVSLQLRAIDLHLWSQPLHWGDKKILGNL